VSAPQFTPGPWDTNIARLSDGSINVVHVVGERDRVSLAQLAHHGEEQTIANASLIAAAPELYEALTWALGRLTDTRNIAPSIVDAEEIQERELVLAKARGDQ
jgi:hypothetical protein